MALSAAASGSSSSERAETSRQQQDSIQIGLRVHAFLGRRFPEGRQIGTKQRQIEAAAAPLAARSTEQRTSTWPRRTARLMSGAHGMLRANPAPRPDENADPGRDG